MECSNAAKPIVLEKFQGIQSCVPGTPREVAPSLNPSATAEDFAQSVLGRSPTVEELAKGASMNRVIALVAGEPKPVMAHGLLIGLLAVQVRRHFQQQQQLS